MNSLPKAVLTRAQSTDEGTFGLFLGQGLRLFSLELPWRDNATSVSCIPAGLYEVRMTYSRRFRRLMYLVTNVPGRAGIRIHPANVAGDLQKGFKCQLNGCISLGEKIGWLGNQRAVLVSAPAVRRLEQAFQGQPFELEVIDHA